jgi:hypothetical protein
MLGDAFVFDGVAHPFNFTPKNAFGRPGEMFSNHLYAFHSALTPDSATTLSAEEFLKDWTPADIHQMVFDESDVDMLVAMPLPLTDLYRDGLSPWEECAELASRDPDRTVFWGSVNPLEGRRALDLAGTSGQGVRREGVEVLQRALRLRPAVPVAHGRLHVSPSQCSRRRRSWVST